MVNHERFDLQEQAAALVSQLGQYTITLKELEDSLLARLANAQARPAPLAQRLAAFALLGARRLLALIIDGSAAPPPSQPVG